MIGFENSQQVCFEMGSSHISLRFSTRKIPPEENSRCFQNIFGNILSEGLYGPGIKKDCTRKSERTSFPEILANRKHFGHIADGFRKRWSRE